VKSETKFSRKNRWAAAIAAMVTLLAVVIGPLCAPICSATFCAAGAPRSAQDEGCHGGGARHSDGAKGSLTAVKTCRAGDIAAILSNLAEKRQFSRVTKNTPASWLFATDSSQLLEPETTNRPQCCDGSSPLRQPDVFLRTTNLRI
jgi:hypothetical protein